MQPLHTSSNFMAVLQSPKRAKLIVRWILSTGCLWEYRLAVEIMYKERQRDSTWRRSFCCSRGTAVQQGN